MSTDLLEGSKEKIDSNKLRRILDELTREGLVERDGDSYRLFNKGRASIEVGNLKLALDTAKMSRLIPLDSIDIPEGFEMRHSDECIANLHGKTLAGCLKVRWIQGGHRYYKDCCGGVIIREEGRD